MWINREISQFIQASTAQFPAVLLTGARQVGKTSLLTKLYPAHSFASLDLPSNAALAENEPDAFLKRFPPPVIIDEVQYAPALFRHLKRHIDAQRDRYGQFILTGSQKFGLMKNVSESLAGRCAIIELETLSRREILSARNVSLLEIVVRGGFPEVSARDDLNRNLFYQSYIATYLERDVRSMLQVGQLRDFERFVRACALRSAQVLNKSELARDVGISPPAANDWLSVLAASNQVVLLEPWFSNRTKSLIKSPKLYLSDTGLLCHLLGIDTAEELVKSPLAGAVWETFVFSEIRKQQLLEGGTWNAWFWRNKYGLEADFLIHRGGRFSILEAKFTETPDRRDAEKLQEIASLLGENNVDRMAVAARVEQPYPLTEKVQAVPVGEV